MVGQSPVAAALIATNDPKFLNDTIRNMAAPWTNRDQSVFVPLNDYTATVIGMVRDDIPFNTILSADILFRRRRDLRRGRLFAGQQQHVSDARRQ